MKKLETELSQDNSLSRLKKNYVEMIKHLSVVLLTCLAALSITSEFVSGKENDKDVAKSLSLAISNSNPVKQSEMLEQIYSQCSEKDGFAILPILSKSLIRANNYSRAEKYAHLMLELSTKYNSSWVYGDVIHDGNMVLGMVALKNGNIPTAKQFLLKSARSPGSYQIQYLGPNMMLAKELLASGEKEVVLTYLQEIRSIWTHRNDDLNKWIEMIKAGISPSFSGHLSP